MLTIATLLWDWNPQSHHFSRYYDESWVDKLYRGFARNLTVPFRFVCYTDRQRHFVEPAIRIAEIEARTPNYSTCIEPFGRGEPMILCGLDTVILRNIDHLEQYCMNARPNHIALPRDPYQWDRACNGVCLVPAGNEAIYTEHAGQNDMEWLRSRPHVFIDDIFPGSVKSYKGHVLGQTIGQAGPRGFKDIDICYFHGMPKMHQLQDVPEIRDNWI